MNGRYWFLLIISVIFLTSNIFATDVEVTIYVYEDYSIFNYIIEFDNNPDIDKFSIEKPKDASLNYIVDTKGPVKYDIAGDYYIIKPDFVKNNTFVIKYKSEQASKEIIKTESLQTYIGIKIPQIDKLTTNIILKDSFGDIVDTFPNNSSIIQNEKISWEIKNVTKDQLFIINFKQKQIQEQTFFTTFKENIYKQIFYVIITFVLFFLIFFYYPKYIHYKIKTKFKKNKKNLEPQITDSDENSQEKSKNKIIIAKQKDEQETLNVLIENIQSHQNKVENKISEIKNHLTENENMIITTIKDHEGISQNDILNYNPKLTKSNLSKIINKLHNKKILNRVKVGKINKIYLGEKIKE